MGRENAARGLQPRVIGSGKGRFHGPRNSSVARMCAEKLELRGWQGVSLHPLRN